MPPGRREVPRRRPGPRAAARVRPRTGQKASRRISRARSGRGRVGSSSSRDSLATNRQVSPLAQSRRGVRTRGRWPREVRAAFGEGVAVEAAAGCRDEAEHRKRVAGPDAHRLADVERPAAGVPERSDPPHLCCCSLSIPAGAHREATCCGTGSTRPPGLNGVGRCDVRGPAALPAQRLGQMDASSARNHLPAEPDHHRGPARRSR